MARPQRCAEARGVPCLPRDAQPQPRPHRCAKRCGQGLRAEVHPGLPTARSVPAAGRAPVPARRSLADGILQWRRVRCLASPDQTCPTKTTSAVKARALSGTLAAVLLASCAALSTGRNYGVAPYRASAEEVTRATAKARAYLQRHPLPDRGIRYLAVATGQSATPDQLPGGAAEILSSSTAGSLYAGDPEMASTAGQLTGIVFFDTTTSRVVANEGLYLADTPPRGRPARFGDLTAVYIGTGR